MYLTLASKYRKPFILWFAVTFYFSFQFILRLFAGILREDIMQRFSVDTAAFGNLAGFYYLGYAGMQIPMGFMLDRFNIRFITFSSIIIAAIGTLTFSLAESWNIVLLGRFLIGAGSAVAFLSVAKVTKTFFPEKYHSIMLGFAFTIGLSGAVIGGKPTRLIFNNYGYDATLTFIAIIAIIIATIILLINDKKIEKFEHSEGENKISLRETFSLMTNPTLLFVGLCGGLMVGSLEGFADVWAIPFFQEIYKFPENDAIFAVSVVYIGMCFGGPILAFFAEKFRSNIFMILMTGIMTSVIFLYMFSDANLSYKIVVCLMFLLGILCCYQVLVFTLTTQLVSKASAGLAIAIINCINMSFGHFFHVGISGLMQRNWHGALNQKGLASYDLYTYILALSPIPILSLLGSIGFLYLSILQKKGKLKKITL